MQKNIKYYKDNAIPEISNYGLFFEKMGEKHYPGTVINGGNKPRSLRVGDLMNIQIWQKLLRKAVVEEKITETNPPGISEKSFCEHFGIPIEHPEKSSGQVRGSSKPSVLELDPFEMIEQLENKYDYSETAMAKETGYTADQIRYLDFKTQWMDTGIIYYSFGDEKKGKKEIYMIPGLDKGQGGFYEEEGVFYWEFAVKRLKSVLNNLDKHSKEYQQINTQEISLSGGVKIAEARQEKIKNDAKLKKLKIDQKKAKKLKEDISQEKIIELHTEKTEETISKAMIIKNIKEKFKYASLKEDQIKIIKQTKNKAEVELNLIDNINIKFQAFLKIEKPSDKKKETAVQKDKTQKDKTQKEIEIIKQHLAEELSGNPIKDITIANYLKQANGNIIQAEKIIKHDIKRMTLNAAVQKVKKQLPKYCNFEEFQIETALSENDLNVDKVAAILMTKYQETAFDNFKHRPDISYGHSDKDFEEKLRKILELSNWDIEAALAFYNKKQQHLEEIKKINDEIRQELNITRHKTLHELIKAEYETIKAQEEWQNALKQDGGYYVNKNIADEKYGIYREKLAIWNKKNEESKKFNEQQEETLAQLAESEEFGADF